MVMHECNKDREFGMMGEQIKNLVTSVKRVETKIDKFIDVADKKYATKAYVEGLDKQVNEDNTRQDSEIRWNKEKIFEILYKIGVTTGLLFITIRGML